MYNRYVSDRHADESFEPVEIPSPAPMHETASVSASVNTAFDLPPSEAEKAATQQAVPAAGRRSILGGLFGRGEGRSGSGPLGGLLKGFNLQDLDIGDLLIIAILILLFLEDDDNDFLIVVGLIVLLGI